MVSEDSPDGARFLSSERRRLVSQLIRERGLAAAPQWTIPLRTEPGPASLSFGQEQLWFLDQLAPDNPFYNDCYGVRFAGDLDADILERCLNEIVRRHEILRTAFPCEHGRPVQRVADHVPITLGRVDLRDRPADQHQAAIQQLASEDLHRPFDLTCVPLFRARLLRLSGDEHVLLFVIQHIVSDGWSISVLFQEIAILYTAISAGTPPELPRLPIQYSDFAMWQRNRLQGTLLETQLGYWKQQLSGLSELQLPSDHARPEVPRHRGSSHDLVLSRSLTESVQSLSRREMVTPFVTLLALYQVQLACYSSQDDILVGTPMAGRSHRELEVLIGFFLNTVVLRTDLSGNPTFRELLARVQHVTIGASNHQDLPFGKLVDELKPVRRPGRNPLFDVWFTLLNNPVPVVDLPRLSLSFLDFESTHARLDLALLMWDSVDGLRGKIEYDTDLFEASTIARMARDYEALVQAAVTRPDARVDELKRTLSGKDRQARSLDMKKVRRKPVSAAASRTT